VALVAVAVVGTVTVLVAVVPVKVR